ncbi:MAG: NAD(P)H-hydrate dehydratase [Hydrogenothermaceae bacterium]|nr:NAD(P)H-hydrate dehydratase [Hydrogenothermaceae bacterium]
MRLLKSSEISRVDKKTIEETGIPSLVLMENAGRCAFEVIKERFFDKDNFTVICGSGNNGGDGLVVSRYLYRYSKSVDVFILSDSFDKLSQDNRKNIEILRNFGLNPIFITADNLDILRESLLKADVIIDAIFGTGFKPPISGYRTEVISLINQSGKRVISIDIPSGLDADSHKIYEPSIKADITVTFGYKKPCHILYPAAEMCGEVVLCDIGLNDKYASDINRFIITPENLIFPKREKTGHKYTFGHVAVIGGSVGKSGAVIMACKSASRSGSGLVTAIIPDIINPVIETNLIEEMSYPVKSKDGFFDLDIPILDILKKLKISSVAVGMGMGVSEGCKDLLEKLITVEKPIVIDADGINNLVSINNWKEKLKSRDFPTVLTPHIGEFSRLTGYSSEQIFDNMEDIATQFCKDTGSYLIVKFSRMMVVTPEGKILYNITGNPGMATAGTGDILAGIVASLISRLPIEDALKLAVYTHGKAGDLASLKYGQEGLKATDLLEFINVEGP